jgi:heme o synthase
LPVVKGKEATLFQIGLYTFTYVGVALAAPLFIRTHLLYVFMVVPFAIKVLFEFFKYYQSQTEKAWLPFFLWINFSVLVFVIAPVLDKWLYYYWLGA